MSEVYNGRSAPETSVACPVALTPSLHFERLRLEVLVVNPSFHATFLWGSANGYDLCDHDLMKAEMRKRLDILRSLK